MWSRSGRALGKKDDPCCNRDLLLPRATEMRKTVALACIAILGCGCTVGPNYKRPAANVPGTYRGLAEEEAGKSEPGSLGDQKLWEVFHDEQLRSLILTALQPNYHLRIADARILQAH